MTAGIIFKNFRIYNHPSQCCLIKFKFCCINTYHSWESNSAIRRAGIENPIFWIPAKSSVVNNITGDEKSNLMLGMDGIRRMGQNVVDTLFDIAVNKFCIDPLKKRIRSNYGIPDNVYCIIIIRWYI